VPDEKTLTRWTSFFRNPERCRQDYFEAWELGRQVFTWASSLYPREKANEVFIAGLRDAVFEAAKKLSFKPHHSAEQREELAREALTIVSAAALAVPRPREVLMTPPEHRAKLAAELEAVARDAVRLCAYCRGVQRVGCACGHVADGLRQRATELRERGHVGLMRLVG
jgi:hypothetical protein